MKRITFAIISLIAFSTISCFAEKIKGNGNIITKEIQVADYKQIKVGQGIETGGNSFFGKNQSPQVNYTQKGGKSGLKITIDENLLSELKFNSNGDVLQIETERGTRINPSKLIIETHSSELNKLGVSGGIDFFLRSSLSGENLEISASGASDVYLEKPTSHNPAENEMLVRAALKYNRIVQVGNQRRSFPNVIKAMEEIKSGSIGKVRYAKSWYVNNRPSIGTGKVVPVPDYLDWDLWQGPAPRVADFKDNFIHYNWHWFWNWGTGEALNNGTHFVDILRWGLGVDYPTKVDSIGGRYRFQDDWQTPDTQLITFQFGDEASFSWEGRSCNTMPVDGYGVGTAFYGETGTLFIGGGNEYKIADIKGKTIKEVKSDLKFETGNLLNPSEKLDAFHFRNWFDAIRKGTKLNSGIVDACISTQLVQLGNIAQRVGHSLQIDPGSGRILNDLEANKLWGREYEKGWEIRV